MALRRKPAYTTKGPSGKPGSLRLYYSNNISGSFGVHLSAPVRYWLENLLGLLGRGTDPNRPPQRGQGDLEQGLKISPTTRVTL